MTCAVRDEGIDELHEAAHAYCRDMDKNGIRARRRRERIEQELRTILNESFGTLLESKLQFEQHVEEWVDRVYNKEIDPYALVNERLADMMSADT
jgi:LAO/AO transport system kinase